MRDRERYGKRVGTVVDGRWRIDTLLGWGSTSAVYGATHRNGHRAALKIIHPSLCPDQSLVERFLREASIVNAIKHRSIVPINDDGITEEGCAYLVLELLEGETLEERRIRTDGRMPLEDFVNIFEELMSAIAAVHAAGIIHRDLKPGNVFLTKSGELKLLDFGTARIFDRAAGSRASVQGLVIGTPAFMSPEQARGSRAEVDAQSDVWSLGAMIFTVLSGEYVHVGRDQHARLLAAASKPARTIVSAMPSIDERVADIVDRALAYPKADRWPDVQSMRIAFRRAVVASLPTMRDLKAFADMSNSLRPPTMMRPDTIAPPPVVIPSMPPVPRATVSDQPPSVLLVPPSASTSTPPIAPSTPPAGDSTSAVTTSVAGSSDSSLPVLAATALSATSGSVETKKEDVAPASAHSESEPPALTTLRPPKRKRASKRARGIPMGALATGVATLAAMACLVVFFVAGGDQSTRAAGAGVAPAEPAPLPAREEPLPVAAAASSFIVITAPDLPVDPASEATPAKPSAPGAPGVVVPFAPAPVSVAPRAASAVGAATSPNNSEAKTGGSALAPWPDSQPEPAAPAASAAASATPPAAPTAESPLSAIGAPISPAGPLAPSAPVLVVPKPVDTPSPSTDLAP